MDIAESLLAGGKVDSNIVSLKLKGTYGPVYDPKIFYEAWKDIEKICRGKIAMA